MADTKISALTAVSTPATTDEFAVNQGGASKKLTLAQIVGELSTASLIGLHTYHNAGADVGLADISSASMTDLDATNAAVTFTAPASGAVIVRLTLPAVWIDGIDAMNVGLREAAATVASCFGTNSSAAGGDGGGATWTFYISGISAGSHTYKAAACNIGGAVHILINTGTTAGTLIMEVWDASTTVGGTTAGIPVGGIILWSGAIASIPTNWALCDGSANSPGPDLRDKFIVGAKQDDSGVAKTNLTGSLTQSGAAAASAHTLSTNVALNAHTTTSSKFGSSTGAPLTGPSSHTITQPVVAAHSSNWPAYFALAYIQRMA